MANTSIPSRAPRNAPQPKVHRYIDALVSDDFGRMSKLTVQSANGFARKKLDAASQSLQLRSERREKKARQAEAREYRAAERGLQAELREADHRIRMLSRSIKTKAPQDGIVRYKPPTERKRLWPYASVALPKYDGPVLDRRGERGVFMRVRYYSRRTAEQGVSQRLVRYVFNGAELNEDDNPYQHSNVGLTIDETLSAFDHLEQVNWSTAKNAKLMLHGIFAVDHRQHPDAMMECGTRWAEETLGRFGLPYLVTLHAPPPDGDARNWHLHILWSFRPLERIGDHEWQVGEMLRTDLDNPAAMKVMREMYAATMTDISFEGGQRQVWTAKSNADRGLPHEPQIHLGAARTNRARSGEHVAENEENHERVMRSKAAVLDDGLRHADEALAREQRGLRAIAARWARLPVVPVRLPERFIAATFAGPMPVIGVVPAQSNMPIVVPAVLPIHRHEPVSMIAAAEPPQRRAAGLPQLTQVVASPSPPTFSARTTVPKFANSRMQRTPLARAGLFKPTDLPARPAASRVSPSAPLDHVLGASMARDSALSGGALPWLAPPIASGRPCATSIPAIRFTSPVRLPAPFASIGFIEQARLRAIDALDREDKRLEHERAEAERVRVIVADNEAAAQRRAALARLLQAIITERHRVTRDKTGHHTVEPALLDRYGLNDGDLASNAVQQRLTVVTDQQNGEIARIGTYLQGSPNRVRHLAGRWTLDDEAPADVRALVDAWSGNRLVQLALERVAGQAAKAWADGELSKAQAQPAPPGSAWNRARELRDAAMDKWDEVERLDGGGAVRPGRQVDRPGGSRIDAADAASDRMSRSSRPHPGSDFGR